MPSLDSILDNGVRFLNTNYTTGGTYVVEIPQSSISNNNRYYSINSISVTGSETYTSSGTAYISHDTNTDITHSQSADFADLRRRVEKLEAKIAELESIIGVKDKSQPDNPTRKIDIT